MKPDKSLQNNILIRLLKTIHEDEWKEFEKFSASPFFNGGRNYIPLLRILKKFHPGYESQDFTKEHIYKKLFPGKEYKESVLNSMFSRLYSIGEDYLLQYALNNNEYMIKEKLIMSELLTRGESLKVNNLIEENLNYFKTKDFGIRDFQNAREIKQEIHKHLYTKYEEEKLCDSVLEIFSSTLNSFFFDIFFYNGILYSQKNFWRDGFDKNYIFEILDSLDLEKVMNIIKINDSHNYIPLNLYFLSYKAVRYINNDGLYFELKSYFFSHFEKLDRKFRLIIMNNLWRLCAVKAVSGKREFVLETFEIRKVMVEKDIFSGPDNYIQPSEFRSTLIDALNVNRADWAEDFSEKYIDRLHPDFREDMRIYCKAFLAYPKGDFDTALKYASKLNINQIIFKLDMKNMTAKIYYETGSTEPLISLLNTYYQLINNYENKYNDYSTRHKNFIQYLRKLLSLQEKRSKPQEYELLKKNVVTDNVNSKTWLLKNIENLIGGSKKKP